jgi:uncharacterized delta-60 repeat protein
MKMKGRIAKSKLSISLLVAASLIPINYFNHSRAFAQDVEVQAAGDLDPSFGSGGRAAADFGGKDCSGLGLAIQADGKLIEVGTVSNATSATTDFAIARFNNDGTPDSSFGNGGTVMTDFNSTNDSGTAVALQLDGRILVAGSTREGVNNQSFDIALARYNANGSLDSSFGVGGKVRTDLTGRADIATSLALDAGGRIVVGGQTLDANNGGLNDAVLVRYNADGSLDSTFGNGGKVITDVAGFADRINSLAVQADGKLVAAGIADLSAGEETEVFALLRYNSNGTLDQSFGTGGKVTTMFSGQEGGQAIAIANNGKIVVAGATSSNRFDFALARYNPDGSLDPTFGAGGKVTTDFAGGTDSARAISLQPDNKIIAAGWRQLTNDSNTRDFALARYNADGSLDTSFGSAGKIATDFAGLGDFGTALVSQTDGKLVMAGSAFRATGPSTSDNSMVLARYTLGGAAAPGFSISFQDSVVNGERGAKTPVFVLINRTGGFTGNITITPPDFPGITPKPNEPIATTSDQVKFKLKIKASAASGHLSLTFTGVDDAGHTAVATVTVIVQ